MRPNADAPLAISKRTAAALFEGGVEIIDAAIARGELPVVRLGHRTVRLMRSDVLEWLQAHRSAPRNEAARPA